MAATLACDACRRVKVIYLDQNKWIELARAAHGKDTRPVMRAVLDFVRTASKHGVCFPLSFAHYIETMSSPSQRRARLGAFMFEVSAGRRIASFAAIVRHELEVALSLEFPGRVTVFPFEFVGRDLGYVVEGVPRRGLEESTRARVPPELRPLVDAMAHIDLEQAVLTGRSLFAPEQLSQVRVDRSPESRFVPHLRDVRARWRRAADPKLQERVLYATALGDIMEPIEQLLATNRISLAEFAALDIEGYERFLGRQPSRRVLIHLYRQIARAAQVPLRDTDLNDWIYVAVASMYCDVVVTERMLADLLTRPGLEPRASVISNLADLPRV